MLSLKLLNFDIYNRRYILLKHFKKFENSVNFKIAMIIL